VLAGGRRHFLRHRQGRNLCLLGESGCGKSVTAQGIMRLLPAAGRILTGGVNSMARNCWPCPKPTCAGARRRHGDDLPGAGDQPQSGADRRPADRRSAGTPPGLRRSGDRERMLELLRQVGIADPSGGSTNIPSSFPAA
jgi:peptide/nickel transport system ATP-binding protein